MAALDAQINYVRARLAETPEYPNSLGSYAFVTSVAPFPHSRFPTTRFPVVTGNPGFLRGVQPGGLLTGFLAFGGGATQGRVLINPGHTHRGFGRGGFARRGGITHGAALVGVPYGGYDYYGDRANLVSRLHELEAARAALQARWRLLEEDARRAGALPGWLRQ